MDVIGLKDGQRYNIRNDTDFYRMLLEQLGDDASLWYVGRIGRIEEVLRELRALYPPEEQMRRKLPNGSMIYYFDRLKDLGLDKLLEIAAIAYEISGWDE